MRKFTIAFLRNVKPDVFLKRAPPASLSFNSLASSPEISMGALETTQANVRKAVKIDLHAEISSSKAGKSRPTKRKAKSNLAGAKASEIVIFTPENAEETATQNAEAEEPAFHAKFVCEKEKAVPNAAIDRSEEIEFHANTSMINAKKETECNAIESVIDAKKETEFSMINANEITISANESRIIADIDRSEKIEFNENENMINAKKELSELAAKLDLNTSVSGRQWIKTAYNLLDYGISSTHVKKMLTKCRTASCARSVDSTLKHFTSMGMSHELMGRVICRSPKILGISNDTFQSKVNFFESVGVDRHTLGRIMCRAYRAMPLSASTLRKRSEFWKNYLQDVQGKAFRKLLLSNPTILSSNLRTVTRSIAYLKDLGFNKIVPLGILSCSVNLLAMRLKLLKQLGISGRGNRVTSLAILYDMSSVKLHDRLHNLLAMGFSYEQVQTMVVRYPRLLRITEEKINVKFSYAVNVMNLSLDMLVAYPEFCGYSYEKRIKYRYEVLQDLKTLGAHEKNIPLRSMLSMNEADFSRKFVEKLHFYTEHPNL